MFIGCMYRAAMYMYPRVGWRVLLLVLVCWKWDSELDIPGIIVNHRHLAFVFCHQFALNTTAFMAVSHSVCMLQNCLHFKSAYV